jgi:hypothetical protein
MGITYDAEGTQANIGLCHSNRWLTDIARLSASASTSICEEWQEWPNRVVPHFIEGWAALRSQDGYPARE